MTLLPTVDLRSKDYIGVKCEECTCTEHEVLIYVGGGRV